MLNQIICFSMMPTPNYHNACALHETQVFFCVTQTESSPPPTFFRVGQIVFFPHTPQYYLVVALNFHIDTLNLSRFRDFITFLDLQSKHLRIRTTTVSIGSHFLQHIMWSFFFDLLHNPFCLIKLHTTIIYLSYFTIINTVLYHFLILLYDLKCFTIYISDTKIFIT